MQIFLFRLQGHSPSKWRFNLKLAKNLLHDSWPLIFSGLMVMVYLRIDQIMIKSMINSQALGNYAAAVKLSEMWYFFPIVITQSIFPAILDAKSKNEATYFRRLQILYDMMVWLAIGIAIPIAIFSKSIIFLLYGEAYAIASPVLTIHIWTSVFVFLGLASDRYLLAEGLIKLTLYRSCLGVIVNIVLNVILISNYGIIGAAISTLVSQIMASFIFDLLNKQTIISFKMKIKSFFPIHLL
jgi:O-antigen/teichoic acid export membrane protein